MNRLVKLTLTEGTLLRRDVVAIVLPFALPLALLVGFGSAADFRASDPELGGLSAFDVFIVPVALVLVIALLAIQVLPVLWGLMVPAELLPTVLALIGEFTPVGATMHALQDAWIGSGVEVFHLVVLAVWAVVMLMIAVSRFRWD